MPKNMKGRYLTDEKQFKIQEDYCRVSVCSPLPVSYTHLPPYAEYKKALDKVNERLCRELGLYYDSNYNLVVK